MVPPLMKEPLRVWLVNLLLLQRGHGQADEVMTVVVAHPDEAHQAKGRQDGGDRTAEIHGLHAKAIRPKSETKISRLEPHELKTQQDPRPPGPRSPADSLRWTLVRDSRSAGHCRCTYQAPHLANTALKRLDRKEKHEKMMKNTCRGRSCGCCLKISIEGMLTDLHSESWPQNLQERLTFTPPAVSASCDCSMRCTSLPASST